MLAGLAQPDKAIPCRFIYDEIGSALFDVICTMPEYYPTRTEIAILRKHADDMARRIGPGARVIELGAGSGGKVEWLLVHCRNRPVMSASTFLPYRWLSMPCGSQNTIWICPSYRSTAIISNPCPCPHQLKTMGMTIVTSAFIPARRSAISSATKPRHFLPVCANSWPVAP